MRIDMEEMNQPNRRQGDPKREMELHYAVPFYNSEKELRPNVLPVHDYLGRAFGEDWEIVLCDDGSTDGSRVVAERLAAELPRVRLVGYAPNRGRGYAVRFAAESCDGGILIFADLDLPRTTDLGRIAVLAERLAVADVVVGSRFMPESAARRRRVRELIGRLHRASVRALFPRLGVHDPDAGFKGFRLDALRRLGRVSREDRWSWDLEVLVIARANGLRIDEVPIDWNERHEGYATTVKILGAAWEEWSGLWRIRRALRSGKYAPSPGLSA